MAKSNKKSELEDYINSFIKFIKKNTLPTITIVSMLATLYVLFAFRFAKANDSLHGYITTYYQGYITFHSKLIDVDVTKDYDYPEYFTPYEVTTLKEELISKAEEEWTKKVLICYFTPALIVFLSSSVALYLSRNKRKA